MTSGIFSTIDPHQVVVNRDQRQRRALTGIEELAESIARVGLINPPVIRRSTRELVAGERRLEAVRQLGWTSMPYQAVEDLPEDQLRLVELEENVRRVDLPWQDNCRAVYEYHHLRLASYPQWTRAATAEALGITAAEVGQRLDVADQLFRGNERVTQAPLFSTARNIVQRTNERKRASALESLTPQPKLDVPILHADFHEWAAGYDGPKFNFIHCDFPYGIEASNQQQGQAVAEHGGYADSKSDYDKLLFTLHESMNNVVDESAHLMFWFAMEHYESTRLTLESMRWRVNPYPLVWHKTDNTGLLPDPQRGPRRIYETAFFASRGDRKIVQAVGNAFGSPVTKEHHMSEKPLAVLAHFFRMIVDGYSTVLDPTCGSGNALIAARRAGAARLLGLERDAGFTERAQANYRSAFSNGESNG
jgi:ParB/RepB/Spo0J family partition protein